MRHPIASRLVVLALLLTPAVAGARQTFKPAQLPAVSFKSEAPAAPTVSIEIEPNRELPATLKHVAEHEGLEARARSAKLTYTATGLVVELSAGTYSASKGNWQTVTRQFESLQLEFSSNGRLVSTREGKR
jgi:hypothetical protein